MYAIFAGAPVSDRHAFQTGLLVLLGVTHDDDDAICDRLADKVRALRIFDDADGKMNEPLGRFGGDAGRMALDDGALAGARSSRCLFR